MQFRIRTLGWVTAYFAIVFTVFSRGVPAGLVFIAGSGFVVPAFIPNVWLRVSVAFLMTTLAADTLVGLVNWALDDTKSGTRLEYFIDPLPQMAILGAMAAASSSGIRWLAVVVYQDFFVRPGIVESSTNHEE
ncbi:hypothetical protein [Blastopirellula marina]|uniref:Uncharacterized protein n=1 Tax=Blastopirellula marina TaxID=124 RepID=A0A2S8GT36_9BACT|nr:hypothetical protein [Blastopirellula marina]PQO47570.1 hypothetical protein C5Y93_02605 [Blastopirellula marina]